MAALISTRDFELSPLTSEDLDATAQLVWDEARVNGAVGAISAFASWARGGVSIDLKVLSASPTAIARLEEREAATKLWATEGSGGPHVIHLCISSH